MRLAVLVGIIALSGTAWAQRDDREMKAREAYAAGRYQEALDIYVKLYAEKLHPNFLRNIGRCYQNLGEPDRAISSFREYLRKARRLTSEERAEIDGYIREMEELMRKREEAARPPQPPPASADPPPEPPRLAPALPDQAPPPLAAPVDRGPPPPDEQPALYQRWWFWAAVGGVVAAGVVALAASGALGGADDPACLGGRTCE